LSSIVSPLPRPVGTLAFLLAWLTPWQPAFGTRAAQSDLIFYVHRRDTIGRHIAKYGTHEPLLTRWLADYLAAARPGIFVDVGANVGWHALHAAQQRTVDRVIAFEPDSFNASLLARNIQANKAEKIDAISSAVGAGVGELRLFNYKSSNFGRHSAAVDHGFGSRSVPMTDLDSALARLGMASRTVAALKIDVEGYEPAVIAGAGDTLKCTDVVILEYSPDLSRAGGLSTDEMFARLRAAGFMPFVLLDRGGTARIDVEELRSFEGSIDLIWAKAGAIAAINEKPRGAISLRDIAEQDKRVVKPI
jgi:FkbM family methyltransferase